MSCNREQQRDPVIVLMTDFGLENTYTGQMKAVMLSICRNARFIDLTHSIAPQHVELGAFLLERALPYLPADAIVVAVVDPGVGTQRKPLAIETDRQIFLGPDNGILTPVLDSLNVTSCRTITNPAVQLPKQSATFHGRDIFSPAAAHLACGMDIQQLGEPLDPVRCVTLQRKTLSTTTTGGTVIEGSVLFTDHFGNLVTTIDTTLLDPAEAWVVESGTTTLPVVKTYADVGQGELLAYVGSFGTVEIAVRDGNAAKLTSMREGSPVRLQKKTV